MRIQRDSSQLYHDVKEAVQPFRATPFVEISMPTDPRVPDKWVEPLVEKPFRELPEHLVFIPGESSK